MFAKKWVGYFIIYLSLTFMSSAHPTLTVKNVLLGRLGKKLKEEEGRSNR